MEERDRKRQVVRKKTSKWCKGRKGVLHRYEVVEVISGDLIRMFGFTEIQEVVCEECGKKKIVAK